MKQKLLLTTLLMLAWVSFAQASIYAFDFNDPHKEARFKQLSEELRCLVCQNQSLADSNADLALDLRKELYKLIQDGATDEQIKDFMVSRYGDFVLYKPPIKTTTYILWFGPFLLAAIGLFILLRLIRSVGKQNTPTLTAEDHQRAQQLLADKKEN